MSAATQIASISSSREAPFRIAVFARNTCDRVDLSICHSRRQTTLINAMAFSIDTKLEFHEPLPGLQTWMHDGVHTTFANIFDHASFASGRVDARSRYFRAYATTAEEKRFGASG